MRLQCLRMKGTRVVLGLFILSFVLFTNTHTAESSDQGRYWLTLKARDAFERTLIANTGASIESIDKDRVVALVSAETKRELEALGLVIEAKTSFWKLDFPEIDKDYHNYFEMEDTLFNLAADYPDLTKLYSVGRTVEGRDIWNLQISGKIADSDKLPGIFYVGGHHAREHLSVEMPLMLAEHLLKAYKAGDQRIVKLLDNRVVYIVPAMNPDGLEFDIASGKYQFWRKNRRLNQDGTFGVDLNRNYGFKWGTGGSSRRTNDETYMGTAPFSEPETQAMKNFIDAHLNIKIILSYHTFSELILYPWGYSNQAIADQDAFRVHKTMAETMAKWNNYEPMQSSALYVASGDITDWAFGTHGITSFTFELDPKNRFGGADGFYPGGKVIPEVFKKNLEPALYLLEYADNPKRVIGK